MAATVTYQPIRGGISGVRDTLVKLAQLRSQWEQSIPIRQLAEKIISGVFIDNDQAAQLTTVTNWVREHVQYVRDPNAWEYVKTPNIMIQEIAARGRAMGDCDDHVLLLNTLLGTLGIKTKFTAVKINGSPMFNHVVSEAFVEHRWVTVDPCAKTRPQPDFPVKFSVD